MAKKKDSPPKSELTFSEFEAITPEQELVISTPKNVRVSALKKAPEPARVIPMGVKLPVFLRLSGRSEHQIAGFAAYARQKKLGPMPIADWRRQLFNFDHKPTK